jgi:very-long-chain (3R)-3-hydroxyacyl-CoA dehydratase
MALSLKDLYLILYNLGCCAGWAYVLSIAIQSLVANGVSKSSLSSVYGEPGLADALMIVQSVALMEIVHAMIGFVRSPVIVTSLQVGSRIAALFAIANSPEAGGK